MKTKAFKIDEEHTIARGTYEGYCCIIEKYITFNDSENCWNIHVYIKTKGWCMILEKDIYGYNNAYIKAKKPVDIEFPKLFYPGLNLTIHRGTYAGLHGTIEKYLYWVSDNDGWAMRVSFHGIGIYTIVESQMKGAPESKESFKGEEVDELAYDICKEDTCLAESEVSDSECSDEPPFIITPIKNRRTNSINLSYE